MLTRKTFTPESSESCNTSVSTPGDKERLEKQLRPAYMAELRCLAQHCSYGDTLDKMLRDQIVWGINDDATQRKLLQVKDLTCEKTVRIAQGFETTDKDLKEMHHAPSAE